jgi:uncharacterized protein
LEQILQNIRPAEAYFWSTHSGVELDLFFISGGKCYGVEFKLNEAPLMTRSMRIALSDLSFLII